MKKACGEMISVFVEMKSDAIQLYDQDFGTIKNSADFIVRILNNESWVEDVKKDFVKIFLTSICEFFTGSEFGYDEISDQGKKIYIPHNNHD